MTGLISIIIPVYNTEEYLSECIDSVIYQSYSNLEIILITEPCDDRSEEICNNYAERDSRIKLINKKRKGGVSESRNIGLMCSKGEYIFFIDSDDYIEKDMIRKMIEVQEQTAADIVMCGRRIIDESGKRDVETPYPTNEILYFPSAINRLIGDTVDDRKSGTYLWIYLIKRNVCFKNDTSLIEFDEKLNYAEDIHWIVRIFMNAHSISFCNYPLYNYRMKRPGNTYTTLYGMKSMYYSDSAIRSYSEIIRLLETNHIETNNFTWRLLTHKIRAAKVAKSLKNREKEKEYSKGLISSIVKYAITEKTIVGYRWAIKRIIEIIIR